MEKRTINPILIKHNYYPDIIHLNPRFQPGIKLLKASILIDWSENRKREKIEMLISRIPAISSTIHMHRCSEDGDYLPFERKIVKKEDICGHGGVKKEFDGLLALAHLLEHLTIDFICSVTEVKRCSGITCAHWRPKNRFDMFIECEDRLAGIFLFSLAVSTLEEMLLSDCAERYLRKVLEASRYCYQVRYMPLVSSEIARACRWDPEEAATVLTTLCEMGFLEQESYSFNFSGESVFRLSRKGGHFFRMNLPTSDRSLCASSHQRPSGSQSCRQQP